MSESSAIAKSQQPESNPKAGTQPVTSADDDGVIISKSSIPAIILLGMTGAGKSTFLKSLDSELEKSYEPCTDHPKAYKIEDKGVYLIDTPAIHGKGDEKSKFQNIWKFLTKMRKYSKETPKLHLIGCIYFYDINKPFGLEEVRATRRFEAFWGGVNASTALYLTSNWEPLKYSDDLAIVFDKLYQKEAHVHLIEGQIGILGDKEEVAPAAKQYLAERLLKKKAVVQTQKEVIKDMLRKEQAEALSKQEAAEAHLKTEECFGRMIQKGAHIFRFHDDSMTAHRAIDALHGVSIAVAREKEAAPDPDLPRQGDITVMRMITQDLETDRAART